MPLDRNSAFRATFFGIVPDNENNEKEDDNGDGDVTPTGTEVLSEHENVPTEQNETCDKNEVPEKSSDGDSTTEEVGSDTETIDLSMDIDVNSVGRIDTWSPFLLFTCCTSVL